MATSLLNLKLENVLKRRITSKNEYFSTNMKDSIQFQNVWTFFTFESTFSNPLAPLKTATSAGSSAASSPTWSTAETSSVVRKAEAELGRASFRETRHFRADFCRQSYKIFLSSKLVRFYSGQHFVRCLTFSRKVGANPSRGTLAFTVKLDKVPHSNALAYCSRWSWGLDKFFLPR